MALIYIFFLLPPFSNGHLYISFAFFSQGQFFYLENGSGVTLTYWSALNFLSKSGDETLFRGTSSVQPSPASDITTIY